MPEHWIWYGPPVYRYRTPDGEFVPEDVVRDYGQASMDATAMQVQDLAAALEDGTITLDEWQTAMLTLIEMEMIRQAALGAGGRDQMTDEMDAIVEEAVQKQSSFLSDFAAAIAAGTLTAAMIAARATMYVWSAREAYERARGVVHGGKPWVRWYLDPGAEHCDDCVDFAALGWQRVEDDPYGGCVPGSGCSQCRTNCRCWLSYSDEPR